MRETQLLKLKQLLESQQPPGTFLTFSRDGSTGKYHLYILFWFPDGACGHHFGCPPTSLLTPVDMLLPIPHHNLSRKAPRVPTHLVQQLCHNQAREAHCALFSPHSSYAITGIGKLPEIPHTLHSSSTKTMLARTWCHALLAQMLHGNQDRWKTWASAYHRQKPCQNKTV